MGGSLPARRLRIDAMRHIYNETSRVVRCLAQTMEHGADLLTSDHHFEQVAGLAYTKC
jgi:predicted nucleic acid-binding protein